MAVYTWSSKKIHCVYTAHMYIEAMNKKLVTFKAPEEDCQRWRAALDHDGRTLSEVCRAALDRLATRIERKQAAE